MGPGKRALSPILIANRGEIAIRVARTAHALGLRTVGVLSPQDEGSPHADACDAIVRIDSYLDAAELLRAARSADARSVHPGYGFLSENPSFAEAVIGAGLTWIGPPVSAIALMGDKARAKEAARTAGVPVLPSGDDGVYPLVVKALAGGGGKGMRVVRTPDDLPAAIAAAQREARAAFGDDRIFTERWLDRPRHIEIQILADRQGNVLHLGERECSLQRRHQKVVEEAPSPVIGADVRDHMGAAAVALARSCGYEGAGTVEFIATSDASEFFFLEMNTRLQVEHPVTELVYGIDLVEQQLAVAAGEPLRLRQEDVRPNGHAVEARLYAEDPANGFLPVAGTIQLYREPWSPGIRIDSGVRGGSVVGTTYDPMLAKVIAHGPDRQSALDRLDRALATFDLVGVTTNAAFTRALIARDDVRAGELDTGLLERLLTTLDLSPPPDLVPAAAVASATTARPPGPWRRRIAGVGEVRVADGVVTVGDEHRQAAVRVDQDGVAHVVLDGVERRYAIVTTDDAIWIARDGQHLELRTEWRSSHDAAPGPGLLEAPVPGTVLLVHVANGDRVVEGEVLLVLESMKMEMPVLATSTGTVRRLTVKAGDRVAAKQQLIAIDAEGEE